MKFSCYVDIDLPIDRVIDIFDNPNNMQYWQDGFVKFEHKSGTQGEEGAIADITYKMGGRDMILQETILTKNLPHELTGLYKHESTTNTMSNFFEVLNENKTRWRADVHYTEFNGFIVKVMKTLMPGMFKKQVKKWMNQFKSFAENKG